LQQLQPVLELRDAELEVAQRVAGCGTELGGSPRRHAPAALAEPGCLAPPAVDDVRDDRAHLIPLDAHPGRDLGGELVGVLRPERDRADPGEAERLECAALVSGHGREVATRGAGAAALAWMTPRPEAHLPEPALPHPERPPPPPHARPPPPR